jgi:hypothetical protein
MAKVKPLVTDPALKKLLEAMQDPAGTREYDPEKQVEGYKKRIEASGMDAEDVTDPRNRIEKALNLREDQNPLFDFLEIINRPQQALFGGIKAAQEGGDVLKGAKAGLSGNEYTRFKEILHNMGMKDTEKLGIDDVAGFAGDVFFDPMNWAMVPATGGKSLIAKTLKQRDEIGSALKNAEKLYKSATRANKSADALKTYKNAVDTLSKEFKVASELYENAQKIRAVSPLRMGMRGIKESGKTAFRGLDTAVDGVLQRFDLSKHKEFLKSGKITQVDYDHMVEAGDHLKTTGLYRDIKKQIVGTFDGLKAMPTKLLARTKGIQIQKQKAIKTADILITEWNDEILKISKEVGMEPEVFTRMLNDVIEYQGLNYQTSIGEMIYNPDISQRVGFNREHVEAFDQFLKRVLPEDFFTDGQWDTLVAPLDPTTLKPAQRAMFYSQITDDGIEVFYPDDKLMTSLKSRFDNIKKNEINPKDTKFRAFTPEEKAQNDQLVKVRKKLKEKLSGDEKFKLKGKTKKEVGEIDAKIKAKEKQIRKIKSNKKGVKKIKEQINELKERRHKVIRKGRKTPDVVDQSDDIRKQIDIIEEQRAALKQSTQIEGYSFRQFETELNKRMKHPNFYTVAEREKFEQLAGLQRNSDGTIVEIAYEKLNAQQKKFREASDKTQILMSRILESIDELGSDLRGVLDPVKGAGVGYMPHMISAERRHLRKDFAASIKSWVDTKALKGNTRVMNQRNWKASRLEANKLYKHSIRNMVSQDIIPKSQAKFWLDKENIKLFEDDLLKSFFDYAKVTTEAVGSTATSMAALDEVLALSATQSDILRPIGKGERIPFGAREVKKAALVEKLENMSRYVADKDAVKALIKRVKDLDGDVFAIDRNLFDLIGRMDASEMASPLMRVVTKMNNAFKRNKLLSPGFQLRNFVGNFQRSWMAGMNTGDITNYWLRANKILRQGDELFKKKVLAGSDWVNKLSSKEKEILQTYEEFMSLGFSELGRTLHDLPEHLWTRPKKDLGALDRFAKFNGDVNWATDKRFRMGMYMYVKEHPEVLQKYGVTQPAEVVRYALFDYYDLSYLEKKYLRNIIPFYTFTKKNLAYQFRNAFENPERFNKLASAFDNLYTEAAGDLKDADIYKRQNFWVPFPKKDKDGNYHVIKSSLPTGKLGEFVEQPLKSAVSMTAPWVRAPFEIAMNKQAFSDMPIQEFKGQKGYTIPEVDRRVEYAASQLGFDVPVKTFITSPISGIKKALDPSDTSPQPLTMGLAGSVTSLSNAEQTRKRVAYNRLDEIRQLMSYYKQEGVDIVSLAEAEQRGNNATQQAINRLKDLLK